MPHEPIPCRVYVILARSASVGVVFRRGPSKWTQLLRWNLEDDTFEPGQWFKGLLYVRRADLSPDGRYLIYFATKQQNWGRIKAQPDTLIAWTAVSRPPYLTALALWPQTDVSNGGGMFETDRTLIVNAPRVSEPRLPQSEQPIPADLNLVPYQGRTGNDFPFLSDKIERDGWRKTPLPNTGYYPRAKTLEGSSFELISSVASRRSDWYIQTFSIHHGNTAPSWGVDWSSNWSDLSFSLHHRTSNAFFPLPEETDWADWDNQRRLVWAHKGKIWALPHPHGETVDIRNAKMLIDLEPNKTELIAAPDWAKRW